MINQVEENEMGGAYSINWAAEEEENKEERV
jgi:hypothetical protein